MVPPAAPSRSSRPVDRTVATHNFWPSRSGIAASTAPVPPSAARAASCVRSGASARTAVRVSVSTRPVVARVPRTLSPMATPSSLAVRGISDGPSASSAATGSRGTDGDATSGFNSLASRRAWADHAARRSPAFSRCMASASLPRGGPCGPWRSLVRAGLLLKWVTVSYFCRHSPSGSNRVLRRRVVKPRLRIHRLVHATPRR